MEIKIGGLLVNKLGPSFWEVLGVKRLRIDCIAGIALALNKIMIFLAIANQSAQDAGIHVHGEFGGHGGRAQEPLLQSARDMGSKTVCESKLLLLRSVWMTPGSVT